MKKNGTMITVLGCMFLVSIITSIARAEDAESIVSQLSSELQQSGVLTQNEAAAIKSPLRNIVNKGASKEDLRNIVTELYDKGVRGYDLRESVKSMNNLVNKGENPGEAGSVVSKAAAQAHAQGLKGKDLAAKVHEAVKRRKVQMDEAKKKDKEAKKEAEKSGKEAKEKTRKIEKEAHKKAKIKKNN